MGGVTWIDEWLELLLMIVARDVEGCFSTFETTGMDPAGDDPLTM